ncbi:sensor histidine kinase [Kitasatospora sp. NPDC058170]|uniref:sensor histidine kinase n=1 Tax=Kitasatospora sp. NPDC058170 TaxID=3346364 RepID=UPI0036DB80CF
MRTALLPPSGVVRIRRLLGGAVVLVLAAPVLLAHPGDHPAALLLAATAALAGAVAVLPWPSGRVTLAVAAGTAAVCSLALDAGYSGPYRLAGLWLPFEWAALLVLFGRAARRVRGRRVVPVLVLLAVALLLLPLRFTLRVPQSDWSASLLAVSLSLLPAVAVAGAGLYLRALDARRERAVSRARREQRLEVARGLHDFVAHEITGIVLEAQAGQLPGQDGEETAALLRRLEEAGLRALDSMDEMVGALREPQAEPTASATRVRGLADLPELVGRFGASGSTRATVELAAESSAALSGEAEETVYAVVLEALTNIRRHAPGATEVAVRVAVQPVTGSGGTDTGSGGAVIGSGGAEIDAGRPAIGTSRVVEVSVTDDGGGAHGAKGLLRRRTGGGTGLAGLAERVAVHGGTLDAGPHRPSGWRITCVLPVRQAGPDRTRPAFPAGRV